MNRVVAVFVGVDLRCQHDGLAKVARKRRVEPLKLKPGQHVVFVNGKRDKVKMYSANMIVSYLKLPRGEVVDLRALKYFPESFSGGEISYTKAIGKMLGVK